MTPTLEEVVDAILGKDEGFWRIWDEKQGFYRRASHAEVRDRELAAGWLGIVNAARATRGSEPLTELPQQTAVEAA